MRSTERNDIALNVYAEICKGGGKTVKEISIALNILPRYVNEALMQLEHDGILVSEDDEGRLYPFLEDKL